MTEATHTDTPAANRQDHFSALFGSLVLQQAQMATLLMGQVPHPESGQPVKDLDAARLFIDHLEMLEAKTQGNLSRDEAGLLKQTLMNLRMAFVQAVESPEPAKPAAATETPSAPAGTAPASDEDHRKKFSKKY